MLRRVPTSEFVLLLESWLRQRERFAAYPGLAWVPSQAAALLDELQACFRGERPEERWAADVAAAELGFELAWEQLDRALGLFELLEPKRRDELRRVRAKLLRKSLPELLGEEAPYVKKLEMEIEDDEALGALLKSMACGGRSLFTITEQFVKHGRKLEQLLAARDDDGPQAAEEIATHLRERRVRERLYGWLAVVRASARVQGCSETDDATWFAALDAAEQQAWPS